MVYWMTGRFVTACSTLMKPLDSVMMIDVATAVVVHWLEELFAGEFEVGLRNTHDNLEYPRLRPTYRNGKFQNLVSQPLVIISS